VSRLDQIVLKNEDKVTGLITLETYNKNKEQEYLLVETKAGEHIHVKKTDIDYVEKIENSDYINIKDVEINDGEVMICGNLCDTVPLMENNNLFIISDTIAPLALDYGKFKDGIDVVMKQSDSTENFKLLKVEKKTIERVKLWKSEMGNAFVFTYKDIVEKSVKEDNSFTSDNGNIHKRYKLKAGTYVIFNTQNKMCYYIRLK
jgi:hypothetical protein